MAFCLYYSAHVFILFLILFNLIQCKKTMKKKTHENFNPVLMRFRLYFNAHLYFVYFQLQMFCFYFIKKL